MRYAILDGKTVKPVDDVLEWARWFESTDRHVAKDEFGDIRVSTVFLGLNHAFGDGPPLWFETMIFGGPADLYQDRYTTWDEAERGHKKAVRVAKRISIRGEA